jgi:hypothetical protein
MKLRVYNHNKYRFSNESGKIVETYNTDKKKIIIIKKENTHKVYKIYLRGNKQLEYKNEIKGYRYFKKIKLFKIPKLYNHLNSKNISYIELEYIKGEKVDFFDYKKVFKKKIRLTKTISDMKYINNISVFYEHKKNKKLIIIENDIKDYLKKKNFRLNSQLSLTHGDLAHYNCLKKDNNFYVFDFEKFRERIFLFDHLNWQYHSIISNIGSILISNKFIFKNNFLAKVILKYIKFLIYFKLQKILVNYKIDKKEFTKVYLFYLFEKQSILLFDLKFVKSIRNKILTRKLIMMIQKNIYFILNNEKF